MRGVSGRNEGVPGRIGESRQQAVLCVQRQDAGKMDCEAADKNLFIFKNERENKYGDFKIKTIL